MVRAMLAEHGEGQPVDVDPGAALEDQAGDLEVIERVDVGKVGRFPKEHPKEGACAREEGNACHAEPGNERSPFARTCCCFQSSNLLLAHPTQRAWASRASRSRAR